MKNRFFVARRLVAVLLLGTMIVGCASNRYGVEISNVLNIREIYIRNAGATNWGTNIASNIKNIDKSIFSERVDIRVIDTNGVVYSRYNEPFNDTAFAESGTTSSLNRFTWIGIGGAVLLMLYFLNPQSPEEGIK
jgi:hypothetical protein